MTSEIHATWNRLTPEQQRVIRVLLLVPLISVEDLNPFLAQPTASVEKVLKRLMTLGMVHSVVLGCLRPSVERWCLTSEARQELCPSGTDGHQPGCLARLLERLTSVEFLYQVGGAIDELGAFREWEWFDDVSLDAAVRYENGWVPLFWVGLLRHESVLEERIEAFGGDLETLAYEDPHPLPSFLCFVVVRQWQVAMVHRVAGRFGIRDWVRVWCVDDGAWYGSANPKTSRGWVRQTGYRREMSHGRWETRYSNSLWAPSYLRDPIRLLKRVKKTIASTDHGDDAIRRLEAINGRILDLYGDRETRKAKPPAEMKLATKDLRGAAALIEDVARGIELMRPGDDAAAVLRRTVAFLRVPGRYRHFGKLLLMGTEFSGFTVTMGQSAVGETGADRGVQHCVTLLRDWGLMDSWKDGRKSRFRVSEAAFKVLSAMDRTKEPSSRLEIKRWDDPSKVARHEYGLLDLVGQFMAAGCPVGPGWHRWHHLGDEGAIKPDATVYLVSGPYGSGWYYIEYELSARGPTRIRGKLRGFRSRRRTDDWPLLVVCVNNRAEQAFQQAAREMNIDIATTTVERLARYGAVGNAECWMADARPTVLR